MTQNGTGFAGEGPVGSASTTLDDTITNMAPDTLPSTVDLTDLAAETGGAWPRGWYAATVIPGYSAGGYQFQTESTVSKKGDSYNLRLALRITNGADQRTNFATFNYRALDFTPQRIEAVKNMRKQFAGQKGKWSGYDDIQRSSIALGQLGQLQKASGVAITLTPFTGQIVTLPFVGVTFFVRLTINEETGYNEITGFSATKT